VTDFLKATGSKSGKKGGGIDGAKARSDINEREFSRLPADADDKGDKTVASLNKAKANFENLRQFQTDLQNRNLTGLQAGRYGVEWSQNSLYLRNQCQLGNNAQRRANDRNCLEIGGVWIDEGYQSSMPTVTVKAMSEAYFRILERQPNMKNVFRISNHLVWVTPSGSALVVDTTTGAETMEDAAIDRLFVAVKK
jgi:Ca-activated chloride channel family protein